MKRKARQIIAVIALAAIVVLIAMFAVSAFTAAPGESGNRFMALLFCIIALPILAWILLFCIGHMRNEHTMAELFPKQEEEPRKDTIQCTKAAHSDTQKRYQNMEDNSLTRYSEITRKNKREIVLLRGSGCRWRHCTFCDYHLDSSPDEDSNFALNREVLKQVTGKYGKLEVINSGSFTDLDEKTLQLILETCMEKKITEIHFECHWMHRESVAALRESFGSKGIQVKVKIGVETFDKQYREQILQKGIEEISPAQIAACFDEVCLLFGLEGQTEASMRQDIETGLAGFERVCINIMVENTTKIKPDPSVIDTFMKKLYPLYKDNERVDILLENTDFGVG